jgi:hypothetical protein
MNVSILFNNLSPEEAIHTIPTYKKEPICRQYDNKNIPKEEITTEGEYEEYN